MVWRLDDSLVQRLYAKARAERWTVSRDAFAASLVTSARREFGDRQPAASQLERYFGSLHLEDLALACACAEGNDQAWDAFVRDYRPALYRAADAIDRTGAAREVADSLYGELFGVRLKDGERQSHLRYFHGRSSLPTWLRAVLAQRLVDERRRHARHDPLPDDEALARVAAHRAAPSGMPFFVEVLRRVIAAVVAALPSRDRLRLRCYYAQDMTLAQIGRMLSESEATVSRSLARTRRAIREEVERRLQDDEGMSASEITEGFTVVIEDAGTLELSEMLGREPILVDGRKKATRDRST
jgi:RNA polymerase sigma-70 factor